MVLLQKHKHKSPQTFMNLPYFKTLGKISQRCLKKGKGAKMAAPHDWLILSYM